jgi:uncharacterized C2H2 Zn-finger protein
MSDSGASARVVGRPGRGGERAEAKAANAVASSSAMTSLGRTAGERNRPQSTSTGDSDDEPELARQGSDASGASAAIEDLACPQCGKRLGSKRSLARHLSDVHGVKAKHACPHCDEVAASALALREHITEYHGRARRHRCEACGRMFARRRHLTQHVANVHMGRRDFECTVCNQTFTQRGHLHEHVRKRHSKELEAVGGQPRLLTRRRSEEGGDVNTDSRGASVNSASDSPVQRGGMVLGMGRPGLMPAPKSYPDQPPPPASARPTAIRAPPDHWALAPMAPDGRIPQPPHMLSPVAMNEHSAWLPPWSKDPSLAPPPLGMQPTMYPPPITHSHMEQAWSPVHPVHPSAGMHLYKLGSIRPRPGSSAYPEPWVMDSSLVPADIPGGGQPPPPSRVVAMSAGSSAVSCRRACVSGPCSHWSWIAGCCSHGECGRGAWHPPGSQRRQRPDDDPFHHRGQHGRCAPRSPWAHWSQHVGGRPCSWQPVPPACMGAIRDGEWNRFVCALVSSMGVPAQSAPPHQMVVSAAPMVWAAPPMSEHTGVVDTGDGLRHLARQALLDSSHLLVDKQLSVPGGPFQGGDHVIQTARGRTQDSLVSDYSREEQHPIRSGMRPDALDQEPTFSDDDDPDASYSNSDNGSQLDHKGDGIDE